MLDLIRNWFFKKEPKQTFRVLDCRGFSSLSWTVVDSGQQLSISCHQGTKPNVGDFLLLPGDSTGSMSLYRCVSVDWCWNVDPPDMWMARAEFAPRNTLSHEETARVIEALNA